MKRSEVINRIDREAKRQGMNFAFTREGGNHAVYSLDGLMIPVQRQNEIDDVLAEKMFKECEPKLGRRWWK